MFDGIGYERFKEVWSQYEGLFYGVALGSGIFMVLGIVFLPFLIARLPADYYSITRDHHSHNRRHIVVHALRNIVGLVFLLLGIAMLVLPGQGLLTVLLGLALMEFPGKRKIERALMQKPAIKHGLNWLRRKAGRDEFRFD